MIFIVFGFAFGMGLVVDLFNVESLLSKILGMKSNLGLLGLAMVFNMIMLFQLGINVGNARKKYHVEYPTMYAVITKEDAPEKDKKEVNMFNCIQRAHQNTLEGQASFLTAAYFSAQRAPLFTGICAFVVVLSKFAYAQGYSTGDPKKRMRGAFGYFAFFPMIGLTILQSLSLMDLDVKKLLPL